VFKNPTIDFNAIFNSLRNSTCNSPEVVLAFLFVRAALFIMRANNCLLCLLFLCRLRFASISTDKNRICTRQLQTALSPHPLKIGHVFIWTYLLGIVHIPHLSSETHSISSCTSNIHHYTTWQAAIWQSPSFLQCCWSWRQNCVFICKHRRLCQSLVCLQPTLIPSLITIKIEI